MRMQDENLKKTLCAKALLLCCSSSNILSTDKRLWLKFLYLTFDKKQKEIEQYFNSNRDLLIQICTTNQQLQKVNSSLSWDTNVIEQCLSTNF